MKTKPEPTTAGAKVELEPLNDRVLIRRQKEEEQRGMIVIPDTAKEKPHRGVVVAVGPGRVLENGTKVPVVLQPGDHVMFGKWSGSELQVEGEELLLVREDEVFCRVRTK